MDEFVINEAVASAIAIEQSNDQVLAEFGIRMIARPPIGHLLVDLRHRFAGELVNVGPRVAVLHLMHERRNQPALDANDPPSLARQRLIRADAIEFHQASGRRTAETTVGQPTCAVHRHSEKDVCPWRRYPFGCVVPNPRRQLVDFESDLSQNSRQQRVLLKAITAATAANDFIEDRIVLDRHRNACQRIKTLEWYRCCVGQHDGLKRSQLAGGETVVPNPPKVLR